MGGGVFVAVGVILGQVCSGPPSDVIIAAKLTDTTIQVRALWPTVALLATALLYTGVKLQYTEGIMNRSKNVARLHRIEALLEEHPRGLRQSEIARKLKLHRSTVMRDLPALEEIGVLLSESSDGLLTLFRQRR